MQVDILFTLIGETELWETPDEMDAAMDAAPWLTAFFAGYMMQFEGRINKIPIRLPLDVAADSPLIFQALGEFAGRRDATAHMSSGSRKLKWFVSFVRDSERHRTHWELFKDRQDWRAHFEPRMAWMRDKTFDRQFEVLPREVQREVLKSLFNRLAACRR